MEFLGLESFIELCKHRSFSEASEYLYISQSSLSKRIAALESELGTPLIARGSTKKFELTDAGTALLEKAEELMQLRDESLQYVHDIAANKKSQLRIAYNYFDTPNRIFFPLIYEFARAYPEVNIIFSGYSNNESKPALLQYNKADAIFSSRMDFEYVNDISYRFLYSPDAYGIGVAKDHPLADRESVEIRDLLPYQLVYSGTSGLQEMHPLIRAFSSKGYSWRNVIYSSNHFETLAYVLTRDCFSCHFIGIKGETVNTLGDYIKLIPISDFNVREGDQVVAYNRSNRTASLFADFCVDKIRDLDLTGPQ